MIEIVKAILFGIVEGITELRLKMRSLIYLHL